jgi:hypothetical protein
VSISEWDELVHRSDGKTKSFEEALRRAARLKDRLEDLRAAAQLCRVCSVNISRDWGRCTNGYCRECHIKFCTPGGSDGPGHGRGNPVRRHDGRTVFVSVPGAPCPDCGRPYTNGDLCGPCRKADDDAAPFRKPGGPRYPGGPDCED